MDTKIRPRVFFSRCLGFDACRYNGQEIRDKVVEWVKPFVESVTVCPEMAIGLGVPRFPIRLIEIKDELTLVQPETGLDCTAHMAAFTDEYLAHMPAVDGFVLKYRSPSCGPSQVKVYNSPKPRSGHRKGSGMFGAAVVARFSTLPIEDEGRLISFDIRQHFLTRVFTCARFRLAKEAGTVRALIEFQSEHKLLLMAYNQTQMRVLGRIVAHVKELGLAKAFSLYEDALGKAMARPPRRTSAINVLQHAFGYVSDELTTQERAFFLSSLDQFRDSRVPLSVPTSLMRSWILRFNVTYLANQVYFEPYPLELVEVLDSGKGRAL
ncbi:DUF523 and DUF1722 domain-containing protein [Candidatus Bipolaricaulota bacterium]|nr:DUF523 and DUF1722 domain-containing protein [Candidatus Bipolaricaulota bacterium]